ncbi:hypothetical protein QE152_g33821 [Popillia japonica]|uniref:Uncharacterized protein n=1 Tax=Popillia japonica TaxID=7064 RepID=A0AAW1IVI6_POPJA
MVPRGKHNELELEESADEDLDFSIHDSSSDMENNDDATCTGCGEEYIETTRADDWIQCIHCKIHSKISAKSV